MAALAILCITHFAPSVARAAQGDNTYMAGPEVRIEQPLSGDLIAAAGRLSVDREVNGDALVAAGSMEVRAPLGDDLRAAGGILNVYDSVAGEVLMAGWSVTIGSGAEIGGHSWLAGNEVTVRGRIHGRLKAYGRQVTIAGQVEGPVVLSGEQLEIRESARIDGDVEYTSPHELVIQPGARISGKITRLPTPLAVPKSKLAIPGLPGVRPLLLLGLLLAGTVLYWLFPRFTVTSSRTLGASPVKSLGLGAAIVFSGPPILLLLVITIIGIPVAFALGAVYMVAILVGYLICAFFLGEWLLRRVRNIDPATRWHMLSFAVALIVLAVVAQIPYAGALVPLFAVILGLGAMVLRAFTHYSDRA